MPVPDGLEAQASYLTTILAEQGPPPLKFEKNKFVLKCFLGNTSLLSLCVFLNPSLIIIIIIHFSPCLALPGPIRPCPALFSHVWPCSALLAPFGPIWPRSATL